MKDATRKLLKKFEEDHEIYVSATEALTYWILYARVTRDQAEGIHHLHHGLKYVSGPGQDGNVLVLRDPFISDTYSVEIWGPMETIDDFVEKGLARILEDKDAETGMTQGGCGAGCG